MVVRTEISSTIANKNEIRNLSLLSRIKSKNIRIFLRQIFFGLDELLSSSVCHPSKLYATTNPDFTISSSIITYNTPTLFSCLETFTDLSRYNTSFNIIIIVTAISFTGRKSLTSETWTKRIIFRTSATEKKREL